MTTFDRLSIIGASDLPPEQLVAALEAELHSRYTLEYAPGLSTGEYGGPPLLAKWLYWKAKGSWFVLPEGDHGRRIARGLTVRLCRPLTMYEATCEDREDPDEPAQVHLTALSVEPNGRMSAIDARSYEDVTAEVGLHLALGTFELPADLEHEFGLYPLEPSAENDARPGFEVRPEERIQEARLETVRRLLAEGKECRLVREDEKSTLFQCKASVAYQDALITQRIYLDNATAAAVKRAAAELGVDLGRPSVWGPLPRSASR